MGLALRTPMTEFLGHRGDARLIATALNDIVGEGTYSGERIASMCAEDFIETISSGGLMSYNRDPQAWAEEQYEEWMRRNNIEDAYCALDGEG